MTRMAIVHLIESSVNYRMKDYIIFNNALNTSVAMIREFCMCKITLKI